MNKTWIGLTCSAVVLLASCGDENASNDLSDEISTEIISEDTGPDFDLLRTPVGDVNFSSSCKTEAAELVERGVALMHNMMYTEARFVFSMADDKDPNCAMAYWGQAMAMIHPLWNDPPTLERYKEGYELVKRAQSIEGSTNREMNYFDAAEAFFKDGENLTTLQRHVKISAAWEKVAANYPNDMDAKAFNSLFKISIALNSDEKRLEAGSIAMDVLDTNPNHPGALHYVIHSYDTPKLASLALESADHYGEITPRVPHASHMLTHTYTRLGKWSKSIEWNDVSSDSALELCIDNEEVNSHYPHALDYLMFAHLQRGDDVAAEKVLKDMFSLDLPFEEYGRTAMARAYSAIHPRYALERKNWQEASTIMPRVPSNFPWSSVHDMEVANVYFARAIGLSHLGRADEATEEIEKLDSILENLKTSVNNYTRTRIKVQILGARAWQHYARGEMEDALSIMEQAKNLELTTVSPANTAGEVLPAAELYGDMLTAVSRNEEALIAYETALIRAPGRYNSLYGAGMAALAIGDNETAKKYLGLLDANTMGVSSARPSTIEVREIIKTL